LEPRQARLHRCRAVSLRDIDLSQLDKRQKK
jgi:hypothetical protein